MKRIMKVLSLGAGVAVTAWALREKFSNPSSLEGAEHPPFRTTEPVEPSPDSDPDDLTQIHGVGPVYAKRLVEAGITSFSEFFKTPASVLDGATDAGSDKVDSWLTQAGTLES